MAKEEKENGTERQSARKRRGEWKLETRTMSVEGVGVVTYTVRVVTFEGHTWEVPDTREGRHRAAEAIQAVVSQKNDLRQIERLRAKVQRLSERVGDLEAVNCLVKAADLLDIAAKDMAR
jgi:hypothetical protein